MLAFLVVGISLSHHIRWPTLLPPSSMAIIEMSVTYIGNTPEL